MKRYLIIVEGKADVIFIKDCISYLLSKPINLIELNKTERTFDVDNVHVKFLILTGYTVVETAKIAIRLKAESDQGYKLIVIQDADNPEKENGGVVSRTKYLEEVKIKHALEFDTFLFPNHKDDGDLETLLLSIASEKEFANYFSNYKAYSDNIKIFSEKEHAEELLHNKYKVFNYFQVYYGMEKAKEENRIYEAKCWDLSNKSLSSLYDFLKAKMGLSISVLSEKGS